jgi:hypothetical protein
MLDTGIRPGWSLLDRSSYNATSQSLFWRPFVDCHWQKGPLLNDWIPLSLKRDERLTHYPTLDLRSQMSLVL